MIWDWAALDAELKAWARAGRRPRLWWRDDDAGDVALELCRLVGLATRADIPLSLAVIPDRVQPVLADFVNSKTGLWVLQHGTDHAPAGDAGQPSQFDPLTPSSDVAARLARAADALSPFRQRLGVYVPPWNDLRPNVEQALIPAGFVGVSAFDGRSATTGLVQVDVHLDLLRWAPKPRFRGEGRFLGRFVRLLRARRRQNCWSEPIGLLTHHLDHDEAAWRFLERLLLHPALAAQADWCSAAALFGPAKAVDRAPAPAAPLRLRSVRA